MKAVLVLAFILSGASAAYADPTADDGSKIWNDAKRAKCVTCHGPDGKGDTKMGKQKGVKDMTSADWQKAHTDQQILDAIMKGIERDEGGKKVKMEPLKNGTEDEAKALLAFVRTLASKPTPPAAPTP